MEQIPDSDVFGGIPCVCEDIPHLYGFKSTKAESQRVNSAYATSVVIYIASSILYS